MRPFFSRKPKPELKHISVPVEGDHVHFDVAPRDVSIPDDLALDYIANILRERGKLPPTYENLRRDGQEQTVVHHLLSARPTLKEFDALGLILEPIPGRSVFDRTRGVNPVYQIKLTDYQASAYRGDRTDYFDVIRRSVHEPSLD